MPNRILREGILTSPRIARLGWAEEVFYRRLHSVVDDFGRYYADPGMLRAACYPRQLNKVSDSDVGKWLRSCVDADLVRVYPAEDGESYLEVLDFGQQVRAKKSKFPEPLSTCVADAKQTHSEEQANAPVFVFGDEDVGGKARKRATPLDCPEGVAPQVWADWLQLRKQKRAPVTATVLEGAKSEAVKAGMSLEAFLRVWCRRGSQGLEAEWLKPHERGQAQPTTPGESVEAYQARMAAERKAANEGITKPPPELREAVKAMVKGMRV